MGNAIIYIHGKGGSADEADHYKSLFPFIDVYGIDYKTFTPWETGKEIYESIEVLKSRYENIYLIANSIGAFFSMNADISDTIKKAFFISPIVDMEKLILGMMKYAEVSEDELKRKGTVKTDFGEDLSWEYLSYVRDHPVKWSVPAEILYGGKDVMTDYETISLFAEKHNSHLTVMKDGEHWFHTEEQMIFLDKWITERIN